LSELFVWQALTEIIAASIRIVRFILFLHFNYVVFLGPLRLLAPWDKYLLFNKNLPPLTIQQGEGSGVYAERSRSTGFVRLLPDFIIILFKESRDGGRTPQKSFLAQIF
jgi:hypothetical protein